MVALCGSLYFCLFFAFFPNLFPNIICKKLRENNENESGDVDVEWWQGEWLLSVDLPVMAVMNARPRPPPDNSLLLLHITFTFLANIV